MNNKTINVTENNLYVYGLCVYECEFILFVFNHTQWMYQVLTKVLTDCHSILPSFRNFDRSRCHKPSVSSS